MSLVIFHQKACDKIFAFIMHWFAKEYTCKLQKQPDYKKKTILVSLSFTSQIISECSTHDFAKILRHRFSV